MVDDDFTAAIDHVEDDVLRLMFICCHPSLVADAQTHPHPQARRRALTTREIARSFLAPEATVAQRVSRAKRTLAEAGAAIEEPSGAERADRLTTVLGVVYLLFNEGYSATEGDDWMRPALCDEACGSAASSPRSCPTTPRCTGSRRSWSCSRPGCRPHRAGRRAGAACGPGRQPVGCRRTCAVGSPPSTAASALDADTARAVPAAGRDRRLPRTGRARRGTDWMRIAALYEQLARITGSPVVELNRAVALGRAYGPAAGLTLVDQLVELPALRGYHLVPSVRGDLLDKLGRLAEAQGGVRTRGGG